MFQHFFAKKRSKYISSIFWTGSSRHIHLFSFELTKNVFKAIPQLNVRFSETFMLGVFVKLERSWKMTIPEKEKWTCSQLVEMLWHNRQRAELIPTGFTRITFLHTQHREYVCLQNFNTYFALHTSCLWTTYRFLRNSSTCFLFFLRQALEGNNHFDILTFLPTNSAFRYYRTISQTRPTCGTNYTCRSHSTFRVHRIYL